jgi:hypothetical protein
MADFKGIFVNSLSYPLYVPTPLRVDDYNLLEKWGERTSTQYAPGFALMWSLSKEEIDGLGMHEEVFGKERVARLFTRIEAINESAVA